MAVSKNTTTKKDFIHAIGRRREAVARVRLYTKPATVWGGPLSKGMTLINKKPINQYFSSLTEQSIYEVPLRVTNSLGKFPIAIQVEGGGRSGQLQAVVLGISRALQKFDGSLRPSLKKSGLLTRDARVKERRKVGTGGKARRKKQSPKR